MLRPNAGARPASPVQRHRSPLLTSSAHDPLVGQVIADRYQILSLIGEGGMGRVYLAEHVRIGRKSAVKVMSPNLALSADAISRFNREAANAAKINHPNVAQIYDFGETDKGLLYLAMEFVEGETLRTIIDREGPQELERSADITGQIADALAAAHHLGIVHRDLKPDNVMVARHHDGADWVKVVDFGIAKTVQGSGDPDTGSQTVTTAGVSLGTPEYMSPEQLAGERLDNRTDLYSLGLVLFNMLTADQPYPRVTSRETLVRRLTDKPRTLEQVAPERVFPRGLQTALDRALSPEKEDRYESVVAFARDVKRASRGEPLSEFAGRVTPTARIAVQGRPAPSRARAIVAWSVCGLVAAGFTVALAMRTRRAPPVVPAATRAVAQAAPAVDSLAVAPTPPADPRPKPDSIKATSESIAPPNAAPSAASIPAADTQTKAERRAERRAEKKAEAMVDAKSAAKADAPAVAPSAMQQAVASPPVVPPPVPTGSPDDERIQYFVDHIDAHSGRAEFFLNQGNIGSTRGELRDLAEEVQTFRALYPHAVDSLHMSQKLQRTGLMLLQQCAQVVADSTKKLPANFTCQTLLPGLFRARAGAGRRGGYPSPP